MSNFLGYIHSLFIFAYNYKGKNAVLREFRFLRRIFTNAAKRLILRYINGIMTA